MDEKDEDKEIESDDFGSFNKVSLGNDSQSIRFCYSTTITLLLCGNQCVFHVIKLKVETQYFQSQGQYRCSSYNLHITQGQTVIMYGYQGLISMISESDIS